MPIEVHSIDWIPESERHGKLWHQAPFWFLGDFQYLTIAIGFIGPSLGLSIVWSFIAGAIGTVIGTLFMALHGSQGPKLGLPQMIQSRAQFGYRGVIVVLFAVFVTYMGLNITGQVLLGQGLAGAWHWNARLAEVGTAVVAVLLSIYGHDWLHRVFRVIAVVSIPLIGLVTIGALLGKDGGVAAGASHFGFDGTAFMAVLAAAAAYNISYAPYVSDYSRYLPKKTKSRWVILSVLVGASASPIWLITLGAWMAVRLHVGDGLTGLILSGNHFIPYVGTFAGISSVLALVAVTGMNNYGASLTLLTGFDSFRTVSPSRRNRVLALLVVAIIWFVSAEVIPSSGVNILGGALTLMLYLLVPWTAINLTDFFIIRRGRYAITDIFLSGGIYGTRNRRGIFAYFIGFVAEIPFMYIQQLGFLSYESPVAKALGGVDISWIVGFIVAGLAYLLFSRHFDPGAESAEIERSDEVLHSQGLRVDRS